MNMDPLDLERRIGRALSRLPAPRAPETLLVRVLAAHRRLASRPWYARAWSSWPAYGQAAAVLAMVMAAAATAMLAPAAMAAIADVEWTISVPVPPAVAALAARAGATWQAWHVVWRVVVEPVAGFLAVFVLAMSIACVAFGTALERVVALGGAAKS